MVCPGFYPLPCWYMQAAMDLLPANDICETEMVVRIREHGIPTFEYVDLPGMRPMTHARAPFFLLGQLYLNCHALSLAEARVWFRVVWSVND